MGMESVVNAFSVRPVVREIPPSIQVPRGCLSRLFITFITVFSVWLL